MPTDPFDLTGRTVLVTGGSGRLGSAFAAAMGAAGARVVLTGRTASRLEEVADGIAATSGATVGTVTGDLADRAGLADLAAAAWAVFDGVDVVVNNAVPSGSQEVLGDLLETPDEAWTAIYDPVVLGALGLAKGLVPRMAERGGGCFVNIVSPTGIVPSPGMDAYGMAKGGLVLLTRYMAREWGRWNIRANALCPGLILDGSAVTLETIAEKPGLAAVLGRTALGRPGEAEELVGAAVFLASDAARFVSGVILPVDGGRF